MALCKIRSWLGGLIFLGGTQLIIVVILVFSQANHPTTTGALKEKRETVVIKDANFSVSQVGPQETLKFTGPSETRTSDGRYVRFPNLPSRKYPVPNITGQVPPEWLSLTDSTGQCSECPFKERNGIFCLDEDTRDYTAKAGNATCLLEGTDWKSTKDSANKCVCKAGWNGKSCSIPDSVLNSDMKAKYKERLELRSQPRRIIHVMPINQEFEMLEIKVAEYGDLVDVWIILESNYTTYGDPKSLNFLAKLQSGAFADVACKVVYVFLDYFPDKAYYDGWIADSLLRNHIGAQGIRNQLRHYRHDDVLLFTDCDEIPPREALLFLKLHNNYPEPFGFVYQWNVYGFFWTPGRPTLAQSGVTMGMLSHVIGLDTISRVKSFNPQKQTYLSKLYNYHRANKNVSVSVSAWKFGNKKHTAGWHCSWCLPLEGMRNKLLSALNGDFPRWGDYPEKANLEYIEGLVRDGGWFGDQKHAHRMKKKSLSEPGFAPSHVMQNLERYSHLVKNKYH